jgi:hypothetical protein
MGEHETIKNGTLVVYTNIDDEDIFGVVTEFVEKHEKYLSPAMKVYWFDDDEPTYETVAAILDPEEDYIRVVSYAE